MKFDDVIPSVRKHGLYAVDYPFLTMVSRRAVERLDADEKGVNSIHTPGGQQAMTTVSEPGLSALVLGSRKPEALTFKRWITHDVISSVQGHNRPLQGGNEM
mgnify:CR=1 FL=1